MLEEDDYLLAYTAHQARGQCVHYPVGSLAPFRWPMMGVIEESVINWKLDK